jgi:hypothetical protein
MKLCKDGLSFDDSECRVTGDMLLVYKWERVHEIEEGFTLGDLFALLKPSVYKWSVFIDVLMELFIKEGELETRQEEKGPITKLVLSKVIEVQIHGDKEDSVHLEDELEFYGEDEEGNSYTVDIIAVNEIVDLPLTFEGAKLYLTQSEKSVLRLEGSVTLIELVRVIFNELSYLGMPSDRDELLEDIKQQVADAEEYQEELPCKGILDLSSILGTELLKFKEENIKRYMNFLRSLD